MKGRGTVLCAQSWVVRGGVGNSAAVFPLQLRGHRVDAVHTVQVSHVTDDAPRQVAPLEVESFQRILAAVASRTTYEYFIVGYLGRATLFPVIEAYRFAAKRLVVDPVMGDNDAYYVPRELLKCYRKLLQGAYMTTPNFFEATELTGIRVTDVPSAWAAMDEIHRWGVKVVIITSLASPRVGEVITIVGGVAGGSRWIVRIPAVAGSVGGTGDLFTALVVSWLDELGEDALGESIARASSAVVQTLQSSMSTGESQLIVNSAMEAIRTPTNIADVQLLTVEVER